MRSLRKLIDNSKLFRTANSTITMYAIFRKCKISPIAMCMTVSVYVCYNRKHMSFLGENEKMSKLK